MQAKEKKAIKIQRTEKSKRVKITETTNKSKPDI